MGTNIIPFDQSDKLPAYLQSDAALADINKEVITAAAFPALSIKGKTFTVVKDGVRKIITKPDDPDEVAQHIGVVFLRANMHAKTFYLKKFTEDGSDGQRPDCYSYDGVAPSPNAANPQAKKCQGCPRNVWGSRIGDDGESKGRECSDNARVAISAPDKLEPMLLRVPPASLKGMREMLKAVASRKIPYNAVVVKLGFDREAATPKLTFKPVGLLPDGVYEDVRELYDGELVRAIVGLDDQVWVGPAQQEETPPAIDTDELDAALAAKAVTDKAKGKAKPEQVDEPADADDAPAPPPKVEAKPEPAKASAKPKAKAKPEPKDDESADDIMASLDDLLNTKDD